jgi:hypothetical protein
MGGDATGAEVRLRSDTHADRLLRLHSALRPWSDELLTVEASIRATDLQGAASVLTYEGDGLVSFLTDLAESVQGWVGSRNWRSLDNDLAIGATYDGLGRITLRVRLRGSHEPDAWELEVPLTLQPGEAMQAFADDVARFLAGA